MTDSEILNIVLREMQAYGNGWRMRWVDFDGRQLRRQLDNIVSWSAAAREEGEPKDYTEGTDFYTSRAEGG